jgi:hypothetical protein
VAILRDAAQNARLLGMTVECCLDDLPKRRQCALMGRDAAHGENMRFSCLTIAIATAVFLAAGASFAADLKISPRTAPAGEDFSVQKGPPNCSRWTDECVNCSRAAKGERSVCSNIGFACQPQAIRCLSPAIPKSEPAKK